MNPPYFDLNCLYIGFGNLTFRSDLNTLKYATNPYNVNRLTLLAGKAAMEDEAYF